jgi:HEAT repeat protein
MAGAACLTATAARLPAESPSAEDKWLEVLKSSVPAAQKSNACRELRTAGTEKSIPVLAGLLTDAETSHAARFALEAMPYPAAGAALRDAAGKATGLTRSGILDSLGQRRDPEAVRMLAPALVDPDPQVVAAAAVALGKIGTPEAARLLKAFRPNARDKARTAVDDGLLLAADRLLAAGQRELTAKIYRELAETGEPRVVRQGALRGVVQSFGPREVHLILKWLASDDAMVRAAAAGELVNLSLADLRTVATGMAKLPARSQWSILMAIRVRGDKSLAPIALAAVQSKDDTVRLAAVRALATVGDLAALPALTRLAAGEDKLGEAARQSLEAICGPKVDEGIIAAMRTEKDPAQRSEWIELLASRRPAGVVPVLLGEAAYPDPAVRSRAVDALAKLAVPKDIPAMVALVLKAEKGPERDEAEKAVRLVCQQAPDAEHRADPVLEVYRSAPAADRAELLPLLGRIGGAAARTLVQQALDSKEPKLYEAGVRAICNWPDPSAADQLLGLAQTAADPAHRLGALRAFIRVAALPGDLPDDKRLAMLKQAMRLAQRDEERALVLERASAVRSVQTLRFLLPYLETNLAEPASKSIVELARHKELREPNKQEFGAALSTVIKTSTDPDTLEKARHCLQGL